MTLITNDSVRDSIKVATIVRSNVHCQEVKVELVWVRRVHLTVKKRRLKWYGHVQTRPTLKKKKLTWYGHGQLISIVMEGKLKEMVWIHRNHIHRQAENVVKILTQNYYLPTGTEI